MKKHLLASLAFVMAATSSPAQMIGRFNHETDILIAQFDMRPDHDDVHAAAALGSLLRHPDFRRLGPDNRLIVYGTIGNQGGTLIDPTTLFDIAFGEGTFRWTNAIDSRGASVGRAFRRVTRVLQDGGKVFVQEAGQSDFTRDWLNRVRNETNVSDATIKNNVFVVQHSDFNERTTTQSDLADVMRWATYVAIDDGNFQWGTRENRGPNTPNYTSRNRQLLRDAQNRNLSPSTFAMWREAVSIIDEQPSSFTNRAIDAGGVDFSDCVENFYIFNLRELGFGTPAFWNNYVTR